MRKVIRSPKLKNALKVALGGGLGYSIFWLTSHPTKSPVRRKLPYKQFKNISVLPEIIVQRKEKKYHLHHWINMHESAFPRHPTQNPNLLPFLPCQ